MTLALRVLILSAAFLGCGAATAQQAAIQFGSLKQDTSLPVSVEADQLSVDQGDGRAVFTGNVRVAQGEMVITAAEATVEYAADGQAIKTLLFTGGVVLSNATDAAQAQQALYTIETGLVEMTGDVVLTQGKNAISGQKLVVDLTAGTGVMEGRVKTIFTPGTEKAAP